MVVEGGGMVASRKICRCGENEKIVSKTGIIALKPHLSRFTPPVISVFVCRKKRKQLFERSGIIEIQKIDYYVAIFAK